MQAGCSKLHTCIISTRSVLSHMEKYCLLRTKESMDPKSGCQTCCKTAQNYRERKEKTKQNPHTHTKPPPNPHSDQLQASKYLNENQSFSPATAGNTESIPGPTIDKSEGDSKNVNRSIMEVTGKLTSQKQACVMGSFLSMQRTKLISAIFFFFKMFQPSLPLSPSGPNNQHSSFYREHSRTSGSPAQLNNCPRSTYVAIRCLPTESVTIIVMLQLRKLSFFSVLCCKPLYSNFVTSLHFCDLNLKIWNYVINQHSIHRKTNK